MHELHAWIYLFPNPPQMHQEHNSDKRPGTEHPRNIFVQYRKTIPDHRGAEEQEPQQQDIELPNPEPV